MPSETGNPIRTTDCYFCGGARFLGITHGCTSAVTFFPKSNSSPSWEWVMFNRQWQEICEENFRMKQALGGKEKSCSE